MAALDQLAARIAGGRSPINIKPSHKGLLHKSLGVPANAKISVSALQRAANSSNPTLAKRGQFALNARSWGK